MYFSADTAREIGDRLNELGFDACRVCGGPTGFETSPCVGPVLYGGVALEGDRPALDAIAVVVLTCLSCGKLEQFQTEALLKRTPDFSHDMPSEEDAGRPYVPRL
jgi:hypothetical protein